GRYGTGTYNLSGGTLTHTGATRDTLIGLGGTGGPGTGYFNLSGIGSFTKTSTDREVLVGASAGSMGTIDLSGSSSFTQNSGAGEVVLGRDAASGSQSAASGTLNISDTATFEAKHTVKVGDAGYGKIDMDGGTFTQTTAGYFFAGDDAGSTGIVNIAGTAQFTSTKTFIVGGYGHGEINQSDGTLTSSGNMYVGNKNGATGEYNLSGGTLDKSGGGAIYVGQEIGSVGTMDVSGGAANVGVIFVGRHGQGTLDQTGGDIDASHLILGEGDGSGDYTISGGSLDLSSGYLRLYGADDSSTFTVSGSDADHIEVNRFLLGNELMTVELDASGSTLITADDTGTASELNGTFALDTLVDFSGVANDTVYDIMWASAGFINEGSLTFSDLSTTAEFEWSILDNVGADGLAGTGQMLQVTVIPEPSTLGMLAFVGGAMLWIRRKFMI
ncbi:MAG: PEP-CTERM sorting domain-containing protein, partial [Verrucomicrobia bacterium]|nr:PEP-CTERM sorting domain-containing protein [Verrucomicrobiota bacterium]